MNRPDRGAHNTFRFQVCARGFLISSGGEDGYLGMLYAFNEIDEVAAWVADEYRHAHSSNEAAPVKDE